MANALTKHNFIAKFLLVLALKVLSCAVYRLWDSDFVITEPVDVLVPKGPRPLTCKVTIILYYLCGGWRHYKKP